METQIDPSVFAYHACMQSHYTLYLPLKLMQLLFIVYSFSETGSRNNTVDACLPACMHRLRLKPFWRGLSLSDYFSVWKSQNTHAMISDKFLSADLHGVSQPKRKNTQSGWKWHYCVCTISLVYVISLDKEGFLHFWKLYAHHLIPFS